MSRPDALTSRGGNGYLQEGQNLYDQDGLLRIVEGIGGALSLEIGQAGKLFGILAYIISGPVLREAQLLAHGDKPRALQLTADTYMQIIHHLHSSSPGWNHFRGWGNEIGLAKKTQFRRQWLRDQAEIVVMKGLKGGLWPLYFTSQQGRDGYALTGEQRLSYRVPTLDTTPTFRSWTQQSVQLMGELGINFKRVGEGGDVRYGGDWEVTLGGFNFGPYDRRKGNLTRLLTLWGAGYK